MRVGNMVPDEVEDRIHSQRFRECCLPPRLEYTVELVRAEGRVYVMNIEGSGLINLTDVDERAGFPSWSPDGNWIAYSAITPDKRPLVFNIWVVRVDGSDRKQVTNGDHGPYVALDWGP